MKTTPSVLWKFLMISLVLQFITEAVIAQNSYKVIYSSIRHISLKKPGTDSMTAHEVKVFEYRLYFNDSMAFTYGYMSGRDKNPYKETDSIFGKKILHHAGLYNAHTNKAYSYDAFPSKRKATLVENANFSPTFVVLIDSVIVNDILCRQGYFVNAVNDTIYALIAKNIPYPYGHNGYTGLPGLLVQYYWARKRLLVKMESITPSKIEIVIPAIPIKKRKEK